MKEKLLISFSGGRTSAMMTKYLLDNKGNEYDFEVVFANTGHEKQATLDFVRKCDEYFGFNTKWVELVVNKESGYGARAKIVDYESAYTNIKKNGIDPFESMIAKYGIPNLKNPHCSRELKKHTIRAYMRDFLGYKRITYKTALGIRADEPSRLNWTKAKNEKLIYLAQLGNVEKEDVNKFWKNQPFDLELKSYEGNCILCWKKCDRKLFTIIQEGIVNNDAELLAELEWVKKIESDYSHFVPETRKNKDKDERIVQFRKKRSIDEMIDESYDLDVVDFAVDENNLVSTAIKLAMWNEELDGNAGCTESCEAF